MLDDFAAECARLADEIETDAPETKPMLLGVTLLGAKGAWLMAHVDAIIAALRLASCATVEGIAGVLMRDCGFCQAQGSPCERHQFDAERIVAYLKGET